MMIKKNKLINVMNWSVSLLLIGMFLFIIGISFDEGEAFCIGFMIVLSFLSGYHTCFTHLLLKSEGTNDER